MQGYTLLRRPRSGRFCAFCDPAVLVFGSSAVPPSWCSTVLVSRRSGVQ